MRYHWLLWLFLLTLDARAASNPFAGQHIQAFTLKNGMQVLVWPDHDIPNVALYNFVRVGSRNEREGVTGLAHFFEHMMFNGTTTHAMGEFDRIMEDAGGSNNAYTAADVTVYQDWIPRSALAAVLQLEADRLRNLNFIPEVVEKERAVVYSERRLRIEDNNEATLMEQVQASAFLAHPYGHPIIGWPADIQGWTLADLQGFYQQYYAPNNCTLVVAGDVSADEVLQLAQQYFESIPAQPNLSPLRVVEPEQIGERRVTLVADTQTAFMQFAFHVPSSRDRSRATLELLLRILAVGEASRLHQVLVEQQQLVNTVSGELSSSFDPELMWFAFSLAADADRERAEQIFTAELARIVDQGVTPQELHKARNMVLSEFWQRLATIDGKASLLGHYAVYAGDYRRLFTALDEYNKVRVADIKAVAAHVFRRTNRTVGVLVPEQQ